MHLTGAESNKIFTKWPIPVFVLKHEPNDEKKQEMIRNSNHKKARKYILYAGSYDKEYVRNTVILEALDSVGVVVEEINVYGHKKLLKPVVFLWNLLKKIFSSNIVFIAEHGYYFLLLAYLPCLLTFRKLVFDPHVSLYLNRAIMKKKFPKNTFKALLTKLIDRAAFMMADVIVMDTPQHATLLRRIYGIPQNKICSLPVGAADYIFKQTHAYNKITHQDKGYFKVSFWGTYTPLHGLDSIILAAKHLKEEKDILFFLYGYGMRYGAVLRAIKKDKLNNVVINQDRNTLTNIDRLIEDDRLGLRPTDEKGVRSVLDMSSNLAELLDSDIDLGIFGDDPIANNVIPNKVYESIAMGKPVITRSNPATRSVFSNWEDAVLVKPPDVARQIADAILKMKSDREVLKGIGTNGQKLYLKNFHTDSIGKYLLKIL